MPAASQPSENYPRASKIPSSESHSARETPPPRADIPFILTTVGQRSDPATRKLIRSHVMLGKNKGRPRPSKRRRPPSWDTVPPWDSTENVTVIHEQIAVIPRRVGSDWSFVQLADEIEPAALADIIKFSSVSKQVTVPLEACIVFHKVDGRMVQPLALDAAYLNAAALGTRIYIGLMLGSEGSCDLICGSPHYSKALRLLRERLSSGLEAEQTSDSTITVVIALALHARISKDYEAARHHIEGIKKIADLRGGIAEISSRPMLAMEIFRCDIGIALETDKRPVFFANVGGVESFVPFLSDMPITEPQGSHNSRGGDTPEIFLDNIDQDLAAVWKATRRFCVLVSRAATSRRKLPEGNLLQALASIMYRLLHRSYTGRSFNETLRLALLAFCSRIFLQLPVIRIEDTHLSNAYRECLLEVDTAQAATPRLMLWLQMIGIVAVFGSTDRAWLSPLLRSSFERCGIGSWRELADVMNELVWIGLVFDRPGRDVLNTLLLDES
ncbi:hypothetical protein H2200_001413 [Cladophialophora chaetospira]|uniref:Tachykinin family protein n=1 Tax=Cladophialophora chaetospira TaxID=386627 RepID=A0AA39CN07_9EURO|nr:hypothetical protein H2200_001413 [Cladophialophora chaetospira]